MPDNNNQQEGEEEKQPSLLENIVDEISSFGKWVKKGAAIGLLAAMPYAFGFFAPEHIPRAQIVSYTMTSGKITRNLAQNRPALEGVIKEGIVSTSMSYPLTGILGGLNTLENKITENYGTVAGKLVKAGTWVGVGQPAITAFHTATRYGIGEKFRKEIGGRIKNVWKYLSLPSALNVMFIAPYSITAALGVSAALSYVFGFLQAGHGEEKASLKNLVSSLNPIPYFSATVGLGRKYARGTYDVGRGLFEAAYGISKGIRDTFTKKPNQQNSAPEPNSGQ